MPEVLEKRADETTNQPERTRTGRCYQPVVDIIERRDELTVRADVPGARQEDIDIQFENGTLTIHARVAGRLDDRTGFLLREYGRGDFHRTFQVSEMIDASRIAAELKDGVLTLRMPKVEAAKPRKIAVKTA